MPRLSGEYFSGKYLWAEDGPIFINQIETLGLSSLWMPYTGYLHTYPRLIGFIGSLFEPTYLPEILLAGWLFAFGILAAVIIIRVVNVGLNLYIALALAALVALQPNSGEVFFTITNAQWILGAALAIYLFTSTGENNKPLIAEYIGLAFICLTGPFSILVAPLFILSGLMHKTIKKNIKLYIVVMFCVFIQLGVLINSDRAGININALGHNWELWIRTFFSYVSFGGYDWATFTAAVVFWAAFLFVLLCPSEDKGNPPNRPKAPEVEFPTKEFLREEVKIYRQPDHGCAQTG